MRFPSRPKAPSPAPELKKLGQSGLTGQAETRDLPKTGGAAQIVGTAGGAQPLFTPTAESKEAALARAGAGQVVRQAGLLQKLDETQERSAVASNGGKAKLVDIAKATRAEAPHVITVHGINDNPTSVGAFAERAVAHGSGVQTLAYDDNYTRLTDTSEAMSDQLGAWMKKNPGKDLTLNAHSMGGRVALGALANLKEEGLLSDRKIELNLVATPLQGYEAADTARIVPSFIAGGIKNVNPGKDMGADSDFQERIENVQLPSNVKTRVYVGTDDDIVDSSAPEFKRVTDKLGAEVIRMNGATHNDAVTEAVNSPFWS